jgi:hypothetical protein
MRIMLAFMARQIAHLGRGTAAGFRSSTISSGTVGTVADTGIARTTPDRRILSVLVAPLITVVSELPLTECTTGDVAAANAGAEL